MTLSRRTLLAASTLPLFAAAPAFAADDPRLAERSVGSPDAPVTVTEFFSLTCPHCAMFAREIMPQIHTELIDPGKVRMVFWDFPLDKLALTAAMVAHALPVERYEPFVDALLASQMRWAFARGVNSTEELAKMAALAGLSRAAFDATIADDGLRTALLKHQDEGQKTYAIDSTPSFIFNGRGQRNRLVSGEMSFADFARAVTDAGA